MLQKSTTEKTEFIVADKVPFIIYHRHLIFSLYAYVCVVYVVCLVG